VIARADRFLRAPAPLARLGLTRALVGAFALAYLAVRFPYFADLSRHGASELSPVGVATVLGEPLPPIATWTLAAVTTALGFAFMTGTRFRLTAPLFAVGLLWLTSYRSSWGKILHSENLLVLHVAILALSPAAAAVSFDARAGRARPADERTSGWALTTMSIVTALTYFVAGVSKLRAGGAAWLTGRPLGDWLAFDALRKIELGSLHSPLAALLASSPVSLGALAVFTIAVELGAPLALASGRTRRAWSVAAWAFHAGVLATMAIGFFYPLSFVAFVPAFAIERWPLLRRLARR
jgi:hypothetical protein